MSHTRLVVGNWKMNVATVAEARHLAQKARHAAAGLQQTDVVIAPPFTYISVCGSTAEAPHFHLGAQSVSFEEGGPHTGEVSAAMLKELGVEYVIVGHSEERANGDTDAAVAKRIKIVLDAGMRPVVCVGEAARDEENGSHFDFLKEQIRNSFAEVPKKYASRIVLAYEPVWAIGAKEAMPPEQIYEMSLFVKKAFADVFGQSPAMKVTVLYGGSANFRNAADIIRIGKVDGLLPGRESVNIAGFVELLKAVDGVQV